MVTTSRPFKQKYSYTVSFEASLLERTGPFTALPKAMVDAGQVFTLQTITENDFTYHYVIQVSVVVDEGKQNEEYYAISSGISNWDTIILTGWETLKDGDEVFWVTADKKKENNASGAEDLFQ